MGDWTGKILGGLLVFCRGGPVRCGERVVGLLPVEGKRGEVEVTRMSWPEAARGETRNELSQRKRRRRKEMKRAKWKWCCCCPSNVGFGVQKKP